MRRYLRLENHPILIKFERGRKVKITVDGEMIEAFEGEPIAIALYASGRRKLRVTSKLGQPRGIFCALGRCTDCCSIVDGRPNVRTCVTYVREGMKVETQEGLGSWNIEG